MTRIKEARIKARLQQKEVALILGVRAPSICAWESGKTKPTAKNIEALSNLYHVSTDYLLGLSDDPETKKEPATSGGLDDRLIEMLVSLSPEQIQRVQDFVSGLTASDTV